MNSVDLSPIQTPSTSPLDCSGRHASSYCTRYDRRLVSRRAAGEAGADDAKARLAGAELLGFHKMFANEVHDGPSSVSVSPQRGVPS